MYKWDYVKLKKLWNHKGNHKDSEEEKLLVNYSSQARLKSTIYKELNQLNRREKKSSLKMDK